MVTPPVNRCKCHSTLFSIHLKTKKRQLRARTAASLECVGWAIGSQCIVNVLEGRREEYMNKDASPL